MAARRKAHLIPVFGYHHDVLRAILFDFNGVLVDDESIHLELLGRVLKEEGLDTAGVDYSGYIGRKDHDALREELEAAGEAVTPDLLSRLIARKSAYYHMRVHTQGLPVFPGAVELLGEISASGLMLGLVSGALRSEVENALERMVVRDHFKFLVTGEDVELGKPDPEGYLRGLTLLNSLPPLPSRLFHPHEVLAIEDSPAGLRAAAAAGLSTLGVAHTYPATELGSADQVVMSLQNLSLKNVRTLFAGS
jgi:phosphoglycolate phosphatase/beta-phosphoglucomutase